MPDKIHKSFGALAKSLDARLEKMAKGSVKELGKEVLDDTPRLTHQLVSNWNSAVGAPEFKFVSGKTDHSSYGDLESTIKNWDGKSDFYFTNAAPYAWRAEYGGWVHTPPYAMVRINTVNWDNIARKYFNKYFS